MLIKNFCIINPKISNKNLPFINYIDTSSVVDGTLIEIQYLNNSFPSRAKRELLKDDILISSVRPNLKHNYFVHCMYENLIGSTGFIQVRVTSKHIHPKYLYYFLTTDNRVKQYTSVAESSQTTFPSFNKNVIENIEFPNISYEEQVHIVDTIGTLDELIENLSSQNTKINDLIQKILKKETNNKEKINIKYLNGYSIIKSGIENFNGEKIYLDTSSVGKYGIEDSTFVVTYSDRPSRANMQPIPNSIWFAKLKDSPKFLYVLDYMDDILSNYIFSTGFLGLETFDSLVTNYFYALITSDEFDDQKNRLSIGATMQGINNDSFKEILVPNVSLNEMQLIGKTLSPLTHLIYKNNTYISKLKKLKKDYLDKFFR